MDARLQKMLSESGLKFEEEDGWAKIIIAWDDDRTHLVSILGHAQAMGPPNEPFYEDFDVVAMVAPVSKLSPEISWKLLQYAATKKVGSLMIVNDMLVLKHDLYAGASAKALLALVNVLAIDADELEKVLTGGGDQF